MGKKIYFSNDELLQQVKVIFETVAQNADVAAQLDDYGFGTTELAEGQSLAATAETTAASTKEESREAKAAYDAFDAKMKTVSKQYSEHRNKSKLLYKTNEDAKVRLGLKGSPARAIPALLEQMATFYRTLKEDAALLTPLSRVKINAADVDAQQQLVEEVRTLYAVYARENNESEQATKDKNAAFTALDAWVRNLYAYAKFALKDNPQHLQMFGKIVR